MDYLCKLLCPTVAMQPSHVSQFDWQLLIYGCLILIFFLNWPRKFGKMQKRTEQDVKYIYKVMHFIHSSQEIIDMTTSANLIWLSQMSQQVTFWTSFSNYSTFSISIYLQNMKKHNNKPLRRSLQLKAWSNLCKGVGGMDNACCS